MCVETIRIGLLFLGWLIWGVTCLCLHEKWMFFHLSPSKCTRNVCWNPQHSDFFLRRLIWGVTCLGLLEKWMFSHLSPSKCHKCVLKPSAQGSFFWDDQFEGSHAYVYLKNECFPIYLLRSARNVCWNHQNRDHFSETIDLRGHMPRFTWKNECFPIYLLRITRNVCWKHQNRAHFSETIDLRGHMPRFTWKMNVFPSISFEMQ